MESVSWSADIIIYLTDPLLMDVYVIANCSAFLIKVAVNILVHKFLLTCGII
jgi:hypothetical protein